MHNKPVSVCDATGMNASVIVLIFKCLSFVWHHRLEQKCMKLWTNHKVGAKNQAANDFKDLEIFSFFFWSPKFGSMTWTKQIKAAAGKCEPDGASESQQKDRPGVPTWHSLQMLNQISWGPSILLQEEWRECNYSGGPVESDTSSLTV